MDMRILIVFYALSLLHFSFGRNDCVWNPWSPCSKHCGGGEKVRKPNRTAENGGRNCRGPSKKICNSRECQTLTPGEGHWGSWYPDRPDWQSCPISSFASEVSIRMEADAGHEDDTALNGIEIKCKDIHGCETGTLMPHEGHYGVWTTLGGCNSSFINGAELQIYPSGNGAWGHDDRGATNLRMFCIDGGVIEGKGNSYIEQAKWKGKRLCDKGMAICGIRVRMDDWRGAGVAGDLDDSALNGAEFRCCPLPANFNDIGGNCTNKPLDNFPTDFTTIISTINTSQPIPTLSSLNDTSASLPSSIFTTSPENWFRKILLKESESWIVIGAIASLILIIGIIFIYLYKRERKYRTSSNYDETHAYDLAEEDTNQRISQKVKESVETIKLQVIDNIYYETVDNDQQTFGINKGGLITNNTNLGETEVVSINENIYYETMDNENISN